MHVTRRVVRRETIDSRQANSQYRGKRESSAPPLTARLSIVAFAAQIAAGVHAQTIGPGNITTSQILNGQTVTVVGNTVINVPNTPNNGWAILARTGSQVTFDTSGGPITLIGNTVLGHALQVQQNSSAQGSGLTITTYGLGEYGINLNNGGTMNLGNTNIQTNGAQAGGGVGAYGIGASDASHATLTGGTITTNGTGTTAVIGFTGSSITLNNVAVVEANASTTISAYGLNAQSGSQIIANGGSVQTNAYSGIGLRASGSAAPNSKITATDVAVETHGSFAYGALAMDGNASADITRGTIITTGSSGAGLVARNTGQIQTSGTVINTSGDFGHGAYAYAGGVIGMAGGSVTTAGQNGRGIAVNDSGSQLNATDVTVQTSGLNAYGARAGANGALTVLRGSITTTGEGAHGVVASGAGATALLTGTSISASGTGAQGVVVFNAADITASGVTVSATAADGSALYMTDASGNGSTASFSGGSSLTSAAPPTIAFASGSSHLTLTDSTVRGGNLWLRVASDDAYGAATRVRFSPGAAAAAAPPAGPDAVEAPVPFTPDVQSVSANSAGGVATIVASNTRITGAALTDPGSTSTVTLQNGTIWNMTGSSNLTNLSVDSSQILFSPPAAGTFKTLTVNNFAGQGGTLTTAGLLRPSAATPGVALIGLNTVLAGDGAPSDRVVINGGTANGTTALRIANAGGAGALTTANGIQVVDAVNGGTTAATAFALDGRAVAGAYEYSLFRGSTDGSNADAWYLRSEETPVPPTPPTPPAPPTPLYRPEIAAYLANQHLVGEMFVHSLHDRLGEPQYVEGQGFNPDQDKPRSGWLRVVGNWQGSKSANGIFKASTNSFLLHGGAELAKWKVFGDGADRGHLGLMGSYGYSNTNATAQGNPFTAKGTVEGWSVGAYGTWYQNDEKKLGAYVDTWLQYGWFTNHVDGQYLPSVHYNAQGWAGSGEVGYTMPLRNDWVIEPQGQLIYVGYNESDITEPNGTNVSGANSHGWITRLGARFHRTFLRADNRKVQPYLTLNWWYTSVSSSISFNDLPLGSMYPSNRYEVKLGVNADLGKRWTAWSNVSGAWGAQSFYQYALRVGVKYAW